jgi:hypothetical protein
MDYQDIVAEIVDNALQRQGNPVPNALNKSHIYH